MVNRQSPTLIFVHDSKGRTRYCGVAFQTRDESLGEQGLPAAQFAFESQDGTGNKSLASCRPIASVSAGLLEMNVATGQFAICDLRFAIERANSSQQQLREFSSPLALQTVSVARRNGKEQFVVLAF